METIENLRLRAERAERNCDDKIREIESLRLTILAGVAHTLRGEFADVPETPPSPLACADENDLLWKRIIEIRRLLQEAGMPIPAGR